MINEVKYSIHEVAPYISWSYFYHAWQVSAKSGERGVRSKEYGVRSELRHEAERLLQEFDSKYHTYARYGLFPANSDGEDIIVERGAKSDERSTRIPMLRQQRSLGNSQACLCLADYVRPLSSGESDTIGLFAATVDKSMESDYADDPYMGLLAQTLADRLAEATVELMHLHVRTKDWGYASDEHLSIEQLLHEEFIGIRPAVGYPSLPDTSLNFLLDEIIDMSAIGIELTASGMMRPHASVSGLMIAHPAAHYFTLGRIGEDQLADYAQRRGLPIKTVRRYLSSNLIT